MIAGGGKNSKQTLTAEKKKTLMFESKGQSSQRGFLGVFWGWWKGRIFNFLILLSLPTEQRILTLLLRLV